MVGEQQFGGNWTEEKLERVRKYLVAYVKIMSNHPFKFAYIDAFAGTGYRELQIGSPQNGNLYKDFIDDDFENYADGSARIALRIEPSFNKYIFIEKTKKRFDQLQLLKEEFPEKKDKIEFKEIDANEFITDLCNNRNWKYHRAVIFLDPFGMEVKWSTIEAIARTKAIDLWYLFPLGVGVNRLLKKEITEIPDIWEKKLNEIFGTDAWRDFFYKKKSTKTLFGTEDSIVKDADFNNIKNFFIERLKTIFIEVSDNPLLLKNSKNNPLYLLCFAASNPKGAKTAVKIAQDILRR